MSARAHRPVLALAGAVGLVAASQALAVTGVVLDPDGRPVRDAQVCQIEPQSGFEMLCATTDRHGEFDLVDSETARLRVTADGYYAGEAPGQGHHTITLRRAPSLWVRVVDAGTGEPLDESEVWVVYPSAQRKGPFPANRAGVRVVRVLEPGDVRIVARAEGYDGGEPVAVTLEPGKEAEAVLRLRRSDAPGE